MKYLLFAFCVLPTMLFAQTKADYERVMNKFVKFYNAKQADSIVHMWPKEHWPEMKNMWNNEVVEMEMKEYGTIKSCRYLGIDKEDGVTVFAIQLSKAGEKATSFTLDKEHRLGTFRFITSSDNIMKMLKQEK